MFPDLVVLKVRPFFVWPSERAMVTRPLLLSLVTDSVHSPHTNRAYRSALIDFLLWCQKSGPAAFSKVPVQQYRATLENRNLFASSIKVRISAIRRLAAEMRTTVCWIRRSRSTSFSPLIRAHSERRAPSLFTTANTLSIPRDPPASLELRREGHIKLTIAILGR
jgi:site-specific recombinase XerD